MAKYKDLEMIQQKLNKIAQAMQDTYKGKFKFKIQKVGLSPLSGATTTKRGMQLIISKSKIRLGQILFGDMPEGIVQIDFNDNPDSVPELFAKNEELKNFQSIRPDLVTLSK